LFYQWDFTFLLRYTPLFWKGVLVTLAYTAGTIFLGLIIGLLIGLGRLSRSKLLNIPLVAFIEAFRCTPLLVQIVWFYFALPIVLQIELPDWFAAGLGLTLYMGAFATEIFRGGIISIDKGQWQASRALGMTWPEMMRNVILPQAIKRMTPPFVNQSIIQLKNTSLLYVVAIPDLMYTGSIIVSDTFRPLEVYTVVAIAYFIILYPLTLWAARLEARVDQ
jgi:polar amino acid transport system permease protein